MAATEDILTKMRQINAAREAAFEPLADVMTKRQKLLQALADIEEPYAAAYRAATAAGWNPAELLSLGAQEPAGRANSRPKRRKSSATTTRSTSTSAPAGTSDTDEAAAQADPDYPPETAVA